jgi:hypothetical protein
VYAPVWGEDAHVMGVSFLSETEMKPYVCPYVG